MTLSVVCWRWGDAFGPEYVNRLRSMLARRLRVPHRFVCVTVDASGLDPGVEVVPPWPEFAAAPNCIRRLKMYDRAVGDILGDRVLMLDVDLVVTGDVTPLVERQEPLVLWRVGYPCHNRVYAGGVVLMDAGVLHGLWERFLSDPLAYGTAAVRHTYDRGVTGGWGIISDQAILNYYVRQEDPPRGEWTSADGVIAYRADVARDELPPSVRLVTIGRESKRALDHGEHAWVRENWR